MRRLLLACAVALAQCGPGPTPVAPPRAAPDAGAAAADASTAYEPVGAATSVLLPADVTPLRYDVALDVDPRKDSFSGSVTIAVRADAPVRAIVLHGRKTDVSVARVDGKVARVTPRMAYGGKDDPEELVLSLEAPLAKGEHTIDLVYSAPFNRQLRGLYKVEQGGKAWAFTQLEAVDARRMLPCFDEPRFKTPFTVRVTVPRGMRAFSNAAETSARDAGDVTTYSFAPTLPLPTYLLALAVGELEVAEGPKAPVPIRIVTTPGKSKLGALALDAAAAYLAILGDYFARPYPYGKLDLVAVPDFGPGAMENAGLVTFREELLLLDAKSAPLNLRRRLEGVMAHELAHQWFGNLVTMRWWDDVWLNEGFATWMGSKALDLRRPSFGARTEMVGAHLAVMESDALPSARPVRVPVLTSDAILEAGGWTAYVKGDGVLDMVEAHVGAEAMRGALRAYLAAHAFGAVTSDDLLDAIAKETKHPEAAKAARGLLDHPGIPIVDATLACDAKGARVHLAQSALASLQRGKAKLARDPRQWTLPVCVAYEGGKAPACAVLDAPETDLALGARCPAWIKPNAGETGWYRWGLDPKALRALAKVAPTLAERERAALPSNAWAMLAAGRVGADDLFEVLAAMNLGKETSRLVLEQAIAVLHLASAALVGDRARAAFGAFVSRALRPALDRIGEEPSPKDDDDKRLLRTSLTAALFDLAGDAGVKATAEKRAASWLKDPSSIDPDLGALALRVSARSGGVAKWDALSAKLDAAGPAEHVAIIGALASPEEPARLMRTLDLLLSGRIRAGDFRHVYNAAARAPDLRRTFLGWMMEHFEELSKRLGGAAGLASTIGWTCDDGLQQRVSDFFQTRLSKLEGAQRSFEEGFAQSESCVVLSITQRETARLWLGKK